MGGGLKILNGPREQRPARRTAAVKFASTRAAADRYVNGYTAPPPPPNEREPTENPYRESLRTISI